MKKIRANYNQLFALAAGLCKKYYNAEKTMFGPAIKTREDEKNIIFSLLKGSLSRSSAFFFSDDDLMKAVSDAVDDANIKKFASLRPPSA